MISQEKMEKALAYLAETDETFAYHKAHALQTEKKAKAVRAAVVIHTEGTGPVKEATAEASEEYQEALSNWFEAVRQLEHVKNRRETASTIIEAWRSLNASMRRGNVT